jgi:hypothetical protein
LNDGSYSEQIVPGSQNIFWGEAGSGGSGGAGGAASAQLTATKLSAPVVSVSLTATGGLGGSGGAAGPLAGYYAGDFYDTTPGTFVGYHGASTNIYVGSASAAGASGASGAGQIVFTGDTITAQTSLTLVLHVDQPRTNSLLPLDGTADGNLIFSGNSFIGSGTSELDLQGVGANAVVDDATGTLSIAGSPSNKMTGFDSFVLADTATFIAPKAPTTTPTVVRVAPDADTIVLSPGHGALVLDDVTDTNTILDFRGYDLGLQQIAAATTHDGSGDTLISLPGDGLLTLSQTDWTPSADNVTFEAAACYCPGTLILTDHGEVAVENLAIGDRVQTLDGDARPIKWIGRSSYDGRMIGDNPLMLPVCIRRGAIESDVPARDLHVSPGHAICVDGALVPAWLLANGVSIVQAQRVEHVSYIHVELDDHEVIFADGCPAESFIDVDGRNQFHNSAEFARLYPDHDPGWGISCLPRIEDGFQLRAIQRRLASRAGSRFSSSQTGELRGFVDRAGPLVVTGWAHNIEQPEVPVCLDILVNGKRYVRALANRYRADLRAAGIGSGKHGFEVSLTAGVCGRVEVRRSADGDRLALTEAAVALAA